MCFRTVVVWRDRSEGKVRENVISRNCHMSGTKIFMFCKDVCILIYKERRDIINHAQRKKKFYGP